MAISTSTLPASHCPRCRSTLVAASEGELDTFMCPAGHGQSVVLHELYGVIQDDELDALWSTVRENRANRGQVPCPRCSLGMVHLTLTYDSDELAEEQLGDGDEEGSVEIEACEPCQAMWFDKGELEELPTDLPNAQPTEEDLANEDAILQEFSENYTAALHDRVNTPVMQMTANLAHALPIPAYRKGARL